MRLYGASLLINWFQVQVLTGAPLPLQRVTTQTALQQRLGISVGQRDGARCDAVKGSESVVLRAANLQPTPQPRTQGVGRRVPRSLGGRWICSGRAPGAAWSPGRPTSAPAAAGDAGCAERSARRDRGSAVQAQPGGPACLDLAAPPLALIFGAGHKKRMPPGGVRAGGMLDGRC